MNHQAYELCECLKCAGDTCQCGCQSALSAQPTTCAGDDCNCHSTCGCAAAAEGCLCRR
jgi:hypothetical protein